MPYLIQLTIDRDQVPSIVQYLKVDKGIRNLTIVDSNTTTGSSINSPDSNTPISSSDQCSNSVGTVGTSSVHTTELPIDPVQLYDRERSQQQQQKQKYRSVQTTSQTPLKGSSSTNDDDTGHMVVLPQRDDATNQDEQKVKKAESLNHNCCVISFRCRDERLTEIVTDLSEVKGVGIDHGMIDIVNLIATKPQLVDNELPLNPTAKRKSKFAKRRLLTEYVYAQVLNQSKLTLDFLLFCLIGAILAGVGLATDNAVTIVASMLVSPLMGPILGMTLGTIVHSRTLIVKSIKSELAGCLLALVTGVVMGILLSPFGGPHALGFPTFQMLDRGRIDGIVSGIVIAFVSGIGVSLAVSHGSINSLVGVAISASLLPPITNTGMLFSYALFSLFIPQVSIYSEVRNPLSSTYSTGDYFIMSGISFCIFILNFVLIYSTGLVIFKLKEFAPMKNKGQSWSDFKSIDIEKPPIQTLASFETTSLNPAASILDSITQRKAESTVNTTVNGVTLRSMYTPDTFEEIDTGLSQRSHEMSN